MANRGGENVYPTMGYSLTLVSVAFVACIVKERTQHAMKSQVERCSHDKYRVINCAYPLLIGLTGLQALIRGAAHAAQPRFAFNSSLYASAPNARSRYLSEGQALDPVASRPTGTCLVRSAASPEGSKV